MVARPGASWNVSGGTSPPRAPAPPPEDAAPRKFPPCYLPPDMPTVGGMAARWGTGGKGSSVSPFTENARGGVRSGGGNNAGHTLVVGGEKTVPHLTPGGTPPPGKTCVIGNGVVVAPGVLWG